MTEEDFLQRWARRKREVAEAEKPVPPTPDPGTAQAAAPEHVASGSSSEPPRHEFDVSTLPPIESINAVSDVTAFLRAGVPEDLTRAALRRVWTADPAIRDFVGLAENAWDFTDPNAMPGFGPLEETDEVRRMIAQIVDSIAEVAKPTGEEVGPRAIEVGENSNASNEISSVEAPPQIASGPDHAKETPAQIISNQVLLQSSKEYVATQRDVTEIVEEPRQISIRGHGRALPK